MPRRKPHVRRKLKINEVSLCGDPANEFARIAFHKSEDPTMTILLEKHVSDEIEIDLAELSQDVRDKLLKVLVDAGYEADPEPIDKSNMSDAARAQVEALEKSNEKMRKESEATAKRIAELEVKAASAGGRVNGLNLETLRGQIPSEVVKAISEISKDEGGDVPKKCQELTKAILYKACELRAAELFPDDQHNVATGKFFGTPDGIRAMKAMRKLPGPYQEPDPAPVEKTAGELEAELPGMVKLTEAAQKIRIENPDLTREQSFVQAIKIHPDAYKQYRLEKRALVKKFDPNSVTE